MKAVSGPLVRASTVLLVTYYLPPIQVPNNATHKARIKILRHTFGMGTLFFFKIVRIR